MTPTNASLTRRRFVVGSGASAAAVLAAGCTGADATEATLSVEDQTGSGEAVTIEGAGAEVEYYVALAYDGGEVTTDTFEAESTQEALEVPLDPAVDGSRTIDVSVHAAEDGEQLTSSSIEYEVPADGSLSVEDQTGGGRTVTIQSASATVDYYVTVTNGDEPTTTDTFDADSTQEALEVELWPRPERTTTVDVAVHAATDDEVLASASIEYDVVASLTVGGGAGDGTTLTIQEVGADEDYYVAVRYDGESVATRTFSGGTTRRNQTVELVPPIDHSVHAEVAVHADASGEALVTETIQYKYRGAILAVEDQSGSGDVLSVGQAEAAVPYYLDIQYDGERVTTREYPVSTAHEDIQIGLGPAIEETTTVSVAIRAASDDERLYGKGVEYEVE